MCHERLKKRRVQDICCTLANTAEEDRVLIDRGIGEDLGSVVVTEY